MPFSRWHLFCQHEPKQKALRKKCFLFWTCYARSALSTVCRRHSRIRFAYPAVERVELARKRQGEDIFAPSAKFRVSCSFLCALNGKELFFPCGCHNCVFTFLSTFLSNWFLNWFPNWFPNLKNNVTILKIEKAISCDLFYHER